MCGFGDHVNGLVSGQTAFLSVLFSLLPNAPSEESGLSNPLKDGTT